MNSFCAPELNLQNDKRIAKSDTFITMQLKKVGSTHFQRETEWTKKARNKNERYYQWKKGAKTPNDARSK